MAKADNWSVVDLSGVSLDKKNGAGIIVRVNGVTIPVLSVSITYGINAIPTATAIVALGRNARTGEMSAIYGQLRAIQQMAPVSIRCVGSLGDFSATGVDGKKIQFPTNLSNNAFLFVGYTAGISYRRNMGQVALVLNMAGKLVDLSLSSGGSTDVVPGSPHSLMMPITGAGTNTQAYSTADTKFANNLTLDIKDNFSYGVLRALYEVSKFNRLQTHNFSCGDLPVGGINNLSANFRAAEVIQGSPIPPKGEVNEYPWHGIAGYTAVPGYNGGPCPLLMDSPIIAKASMAISNNISSSVASTSMWGMLLGTILPSFGCAIIPRATSAILAPVLPNAQLESLTIPVEDYFDFDMTTMSQRPLFGVGVLSSYSIGTDAKSSSFLCIGGGYTADRDEVMAVNNGMWMFVNAPDWIENWTNFDPKARTGDAMVNKMLATPSHDAAGVSTASVSRDTAPEAKPVSDAMRKYAQMVYGANALRGRDGMLVGKLRFDVTPGMTIRILGEQVVPDDRIGVDRMGTNLYAFVNQVTLTINPAQMAASTAFRLSNIRTEFENSSPRFAMTEHPFFGDNWFRSAPLIPDLLGK